MSGSQAHVGARFRGQPLVMLGAVMLGWIGLRVVTWESPFPFTPESPAMAASDLLPRAPAAPRLGSSPRYGEPGVPPGGGERDAAEARGEGSRNGELGGEEWRRPLPAEAPAQPGWDRLPALPPPNPSVAGEASRGAPPVTAAPGRLVGTANGHALLLLAGMSGLKLPAQLMAMLEGARAPAPPLLAPRGSANRARADAQPGLSGTREAAVPSSPAAAPAGIVPAIGGSRLARWTADAWLLLRDEGEAPRQPGLEAYGRSQAGAVLRYRLAPGSRHAPQAHLRGSTALKSGGSDLQDREVAAGLSARPIPRVPVRVAAELRVSDLPIGTEVRPAAYAVTELPPVSLPLGARGELYLQGGWVGGTYETAFIDGQARIDRPLARLGPIELAGGGAAWGGTQVGTERLDAGPSVSAVVGLGRVRARVSADYRFRLAGDAEPGSGPALTLYAGF